MAGGGGKPVTLTLQVADLTNNRLKQFVQDVVALRDAQKSLNGAADPQYQILARQAQQLRGLSKDFGQAESAARGFTGQVQKLTGARSLLRGVLGGAGGGMVADLVGLGGAMAAISAAGLLVGQSVRMAYEFERVTTRAAQQFGIGTAAPLATNLAAMRVAAYSGERYGYNALVMGNALAGYGAASGATAQQIAAAGPGIAQYARAYGLDPNTVGTMVGQYQAYGGGTFGGDAAGLFGGAEEAGPLGRRLGEFIGTATNVLSQFEMGNPTGKYSPNDIAGYVANISRLGGVYSTSQGVLATEGALSSLTQGGSSDIRRAALMARAGLKDKDIILGINSPQNQRKIYDELLKESGGVKSPLFWANLVGMVGQEGARMLVGASEKSGGGSGFIGGSAPDAPLFERLQEALKTPLASIDQTLATLTNTMIADGDKVLQALGGGDITQLLTAIAAATAASAVFGGGGAGGAARALLTRLGIPALSFLGAGSAAVGAGAVAGGAAGAFGLFSGIHWLLNSGGMHMDAVHAMTQMIAAGMPENEARARANLLAQDQFTYAANAGDITSRAYTTPGLVAMLQRASNGYNLNVTALNRGHHPDLWHSRGLAADIGAIDGHTVNGTEDPYIKAWLLKQIDTNPYLHQLGLGSAYLSDADIDADMKRHGITSWEEPNNHIHAGAGVARSAQTVTAHGVEVKVEVKPKRTPNTGNRISMRGHRG